MKHWFKKKETTAHLVSQEETPGLLSEQGANREAKQPSVGSKEATIHAIEGETENYSKEKVQAVGPKEAETIQAKERGEEQRNLRSNDQAVGPQKSGSNRKTLLKKLDLYIIKKFLGTYFFAITLIISIAVVFDFNEHIDNFITNKAPLKAIVFDYYLNFIPYYSNLFSPLFVFIAVIFFTSKLAENSEIIAMFSTGMSFKRMMLPYMISAGIISAVTLTLGSYIIPKGNVTRLEFENKYKRKKKQEFVRNVQLEVDNGVIAYMERYENYNKTAYRFSLDKFDEKVLVSHLTARTATYEGDHKWVVKNYMIREMDGMREIITKGERLDTIIKMEPQDFLISKGQQQTMTSPELKEYIDKQKRRGFANIKEFEIEYYQRFAMGFAAFILTTIGVSLSSRKVKGGIGLHLGIGLGLSFSYILFQTVSATFAVSGSAPPIVAVWVPNVLYTLIAIYLYHKAPK
ncbi:MAG: LptF/LptG family permease [Phocaeicola sp.]